MTEKKFPRGRILGFRPRFVYKVRRGWKRHTIRAGELWQAGMMAHLFENVRTRKQKLIFRAPVVKVEHITITPKLFAIVVDGHVLADDERHALATADGFKDIEEMREFWKPQLRKLDKRSQYWHGQIVHWDFARRTRKPISAPTRRRQQPNAKQKPTNKGKQQ